MAVVCLQEEATAAEPFMATSTQFETAVNTKFTLVRRRGNRKKRGFMWGLFKKKNACNCPKH